MDSRYSGSANKAAKFSGPTNTLRWPNGSCRVRLDQIACAAGQRKKTPVSTSCGASSSAGRARCGKIVRRSIPYRPAAARSDAGGSLELAQHPIAARDGVVHRHLGTLVAGQGPLELLLDDVAYLRQAPEA